MIDPTKPMYDAEGREWVALRMPDGSVWKPAERSFLVVMTGDDGYSRTVGSDGVALFVDMTLINTKPQKDCEDRIFWSLDGEIVKIDLRRRSGVITAEVVND